jgi:hypothetical protein
MNKLLGLRSKTLPGSFLLSLSVGAGIRLGETFQGVGKGREEKQKIGESICLLLLAASKIEKYTDLGICTKILDVPICLYKREWERLRFAASPTKCPCENFLGFHTKWHSENFLEFPLNALLKIFWKNVLR